MKYKINIGKIALLLCNFILLLSGFCLILLGCILLNDSPRILLSHLALEPGTLPQPLLYYVALGFVTVGMIVSSVALLGCWTALGPESNCLMAFYVFLLVVLLLMEISVGVVGSLCPQAFGSGMDRDQMVASLMNNYGVPGRDQYTAAVDLAQTVFECCGIQSGSDFDGSRWWKREQDANHQLRVPRSCCFLENTNSENAFLDPLPVNLTLCQAKTNARYQHGRHVKGCIDRLNNWFKEHISIFLTIGLALIVVQLSVLLCAIIVCLRKKKVIPSALQSEESTQRRATRDSGAKQMSNHDNGFELNSEEKQTNGGSSHENGFSIISRGPNYAQKHINSKRNIIKNINTFDTEESVDAKANDSPVSSAFAVRNDHFLNFDENRNRPQHYTARGPGNRFYTVQEDRNRQPVGYHYKMESPQNTVNNSGYEYDAMTHFFCKGNDLSAANVRSGNELGT